MKWSSSHPLLVSLLVIFCAACAEAWIAMEKASRIKNHPGHCLETIHNIGQMEQNEVRRIEGMCAIATCQSNRDIRYSGCPLVKVKPPCKIVPGEEWKEYPECCFELRCDEEKEQDKGNTEAESTASKNK